MAAKRARKAARKATAPQLTPGARKLLRLLKELDIPYTKFAKMAGINRLQLYRVLNGMTQQISVDFAMAVEKASKGVIEVKDFGSAVVTGGDELFDRRQRALARRRPAARRTTSVQV